MTDKEEHTPSAIPLKAVEILTLAFCIMGIWMTLNGLPFLASAFASLLLSGSPPTSSLIITDRDTFADLLTQLSWSVIPIIIGISLVFGARKLADKLVVHYRLATIPKESS